MPMIFLEIAAMIAAVLLVDKTSSLLMTPLTTPDAFLAGMPHAQITIFAHPVTLIQPSSTALVYLLGLVMTGLGIWLTATRGESKARLYWGVGLVLWGLGALAAGTSYQAFGYELKCAGREACTFTSPFELAYLLLTAYSIDFLVAAAGHTSLGETGSRRLTRYALLHAVGYSTFLLVGAALPVRFMVSYEGFMACVGVNFVLMFALALRHTLKHHDRLNRRLAWLWIGFLVVNLGYFAALFSGFPASLYASNGIWFHANDVLHALILLWAVQVGWTVREI